MVDQRLLREVVRHQEAAYRHAYETPPVADNEIQFPHWATMMQDAVVSASVHSIVYAVLARPYSVEAADRSSHSVMLAHWIERQLECVDVDAALVSALEALWRGFSAQEISWRYEKPFFVLSAIGDVSPDQIAFEVDDQMRVTALLSKPQSALSETQRLPVEKVWLHRNAPSRQRVAGRSVLESAYRSWRSKDNILKFWGLALQRFGMPYVICQVPETTDDALAQSIMEKWYAMRLDGILLLPETVAYQVHAPAYATTVTFSEAVHFHDAQIRQAILLQWTAGTILGKEFTSGSGLEILARVTGYALSRHARSLSASFTDQVIRPLVRANFGEFALPYCPRLAIPTPGESHLTDLVTAWVKLVEAGIATPAQAADEIGFEYDPSVERGVGGGT